MTPIEKLEFLKWLLNWLEENDFSGLIKPVVEEFRQIVQQSSDSTNVLQKNESDTPSCCAISPALDRYYLRERPTQ